MSVARPYTPRRLGPALALALLALAAGPGGAARARALSASQAAGAWDLSFEKGNRRCRLTLRAEAGPGGHQLSMPAGCHRAFPILAAVEGWAATDKGHLVFRAASGRTVIDFGPTGGPGLSALVGESADTYEMIPASPAAAALLAQEAEPPAEVASPAPAMSAAPGGGVLVDSSTPAKAAGAAAPVTLPPVTASEVAGHYAVLRQSRDTGCMVTLEPGAGERAEMRARLAPACRDQGIVIFDPVGWQLSKGQQMILTAKKGHKASLTRRQDHTWATTPAKGAALVLKRL